MSRPDGKTPPSLRHFRDLTQARIALGNYGAGVPTKAALRFSLDHAKAREAVWTAMDSADLAEKLAARGMKSHLVRSRAASRHDYLQRPDLGRALCDESTASLMALPKPDAGYDIALIIGDGLSATAIALNAAPLAEAIWRQVKHNGLSVAPVIIAEQARVALGDPIGVALQARCTIMLIGERPGLSAADSLGCYITHTPQPGLPDSRRNCISNIRSGGLGIDAAAAQIDMLTRLMMEQRTSGVGLRRTETKPLIE